MNDAQENSLDAEGAVAIEQKPVGSRNLIRDLFGILFDPIKTFRNVLDAKYWIGIVLIIVIVAAGLEIIYHPILVEMSITKMMEKAGDNAAGMTAGADFLRGPIYRFAMPFFYGIIQVIGILLWTALSFFLASVVFGGTAKFKDVWIICSWASVITLLSQIVKTPLILATKNIEAGINLGLVFSENLVGATFHRAMSVIDLFGIWYFIVFGMGLAIVYGFPTKKGISISFIVWLVLTLVGIVSVLVTGGA